MMHFQFKTLTLQCRESKEVLDISYQISFFHGKVSSGKSSIARLVDYCLGGDIEKTPAIMRELLSVSLELVIGDYDVLIERDVNTALLKVSWIDSEKNVSSVYTPVSAGEKPVLGETVYSLSDIIYYFLGMKPIKMSGSNNIEDAQLIRLSIRNFLWYCYLDQTHLDSSFYRLEDTNKMRSSRQVMRLAMRYSTQKIYELEEEFIKNRETRNSKINTAINLKSFLEQFGFSTVEEIEKTIVNTQKKYNEAVAERQRLQNVYTAETHSSDKTREELRMLSIDIDTIENALIDLEKSIYEQEALKSEIISSKFKLAKSQSAYNVLSGVKFESCPCCGISIEHRALPKDYCPLCTSEHITDSSNLDAGSNNEVIRLDLDSREKDINESINIHKKALQRKKRELENKHKIKRGLDEKLVAELRSYESMFLVNIRDVDRRVAKYQERLRSQSQLKMMPIEINKLEFEAAELERRAERIKQDLNTERAKLTNAEYNIRDLEYTFLNTLLTVGLPGISPEDEVHINRRTWDVWVYPNGNEQLKWNFYNAGSGGKKTLFNVCYLLSLHIVASKNDLMLPSFMIIDTPMKNIDKEVNEDLFKRFYDYVYALADAELKSTQIIIIDNSFIAPKPNSNLSFKNRYMTDNDENHPPLISYYRGA